MESLVHSQRHVNLRIRNLFGDDPSPNATAAIPNPEPNLDESGIAISSDANSAPADLRAWISERIGELDQKISNLEQSLEDRFTKLETLLQGMAQER